MKYQALLNQLIEIRGYLLESVQGLSADRATAIPPGFRNNILWNLGHVITDNCTMLYPPAGLPYPLPEQYLEWFGTGTSPADWRETPDLAAVLEWAVLIRDRVVQDCRDGRMEQFERQTLDDGAVLDNIASALAHCNIHEGVHLGVILSLRKLV